MPWLHVIIWKKIKMALGYMKQGMKYGATGQFKAGLEWARMQSPEKHGAVDDMEKKKEGS